MHELHRSAFSIFAPLAVAAAVGLHAWGQATSAPEQLLHPQGGTGPSFEVASVKPNHNPANVFSFRLQPAGFKADGAPLDRLIRFAYEVKSDQQILNMPNWAISEHFDIDAKISDADVAALKKLTPGQSFHQYRLMLQSLLADRFRMKVRTEMRLLPVYALAAAKHDLSRKRGPEGFLSHDARLCSVAFRKTGHRRPRCDRRYRP